jgi:hypothetical protein
MYKATIVQVVYNGQYTLGLDAEGNLWKLSDLEYVTGGTAEEMANPQYEKEWVLVLHNNKERKGSPEAALDF